MTDTKALHHDNDFSTTAIARAVADGTRDPLDAVGASLKAIAAHDSDLRAWVYVPDAEWLATQPRPAPHGLLAGVPIGVKDIIDVAGMPTQCGADVCGQEPVLFDAACVAELRRAGAVPVGKTVTAEFAYVSPGPTRNPAHHGHTPGGSSSGSAAAVAAGMVPVALGTQTGGSIIRPAAFCGVVGFKPTYGMVSRDGMKLTCESLDVIGWHAANVEDAACIADVLLPRPAQAGSSAGDELPLLAFLRHQPHHTLDPEAEAVLDDAQRSLHAAGARFEAANLSEPVAAAMLGAHSTIMHYEFARNLWPVVADHRDRLSAALTATVDKGFGVPGDDYFEARAAQHNWRTSWETICGNASFLLTSSALGPAPEGLSSTGNSAFNKAWSLLGWPCVHLPVGYSATGLPLGVQLIGPPGSDRRLLALAAVIHPLIDRRRQRIR